MPIYEYRCSSCGFQKEYIQKMSDAPLTACPECKQETFVKMLSAAGFHLKGSGWYQTDFKGGSKSKEESKAAAPGCCGGGCGCGG
ncbi:MAG: FmdB family transcriptional regulator [Betaproteobacteria bacterium CG2_30_59_46]|nr:MAG: FmdB family transcriptional regulator [Betaproteobacteria bacterium CG2_30_59_46]PIQ12468.1 MAG: FmdB family transcriptional regulator [Hydrogenophilales bacterium CG18_big_fil_WC_8_21_14_2_50_58_12]PIY00785.1 MAG: FmdB family transcriptional regulator [Hydrogenophilales bacterium CG_4_10_14_3_um_filter_58_23]PJB08887.1 MAG: FmdB family transcriptional regulator [Hydrogenophilales bacterium CG_4_9_14_3_um_filter_59_35]